MVANETTTARPTFVTTSSPPEAATVHLQAPEVKILAPTPETPSSNAPLSRPPSTDPWADLLKPQVFIVKNPMHVINFNKHKSKSKVVRFFQLIKSFTEKWFSHILLLVVLGLYGCFGAWMFILIEGEVRHEIEKPVHNMKERIKNDILYFAVHRQYSRDFVAQLVDKRLQEFELQIQENCKSGYDGENPLKTWSFSNALFFCVTVFTTIGYGHICPETPYGQVFCVVYAFFGIPLVLIVLTDLGKLFTRMIKTTMRFFSSIFRHRKLKAVRRIGRRATMAPAQFWADTKRRLSSIPGEAVSDVATEKTEITFTPNANGGFNAVKGNEKFHTMGTPPPIVISQSPFGPMKSTDTFNAFGPAGESSGTHYSADDVVPYEVDEEFNLPVSVAMFILSLYFLLGSVLFFNTENWTLMESFYFVYISLTTVGFGDYVPESPILMLASSIYILFGLALTSMCINVIQEKLNQSLERAKERLGARIGISTEVEPAVLPQPSTSNNAPRKKSISDTDKPKTFLQEENVGAKMKQRREQKKQEITLAVPDANC